MVEDVRRSGHVIGAPEGLQFEFHLDPADEQGLARGEGRVSLNGEPVWFAENAGGEELPLDWTWVDLLAFLGRWWPWLAHEQDYPLDVNPWSPAFFLDEAEARWRDLPQEQVEEEEGQAHRFLARHDLAEGLKGLFVPSLVLLRQGNVCLVSARAIRQTRIRPWPEVRDTLEEVGDYLAGAVASSPNPRAQQALTWWHDREVRRADRELDIETALSSEERARAVEAGLAENEWHLPEIRAVARMGRGTIRETDRQTLLLQIAASPQIPTPELDDLTAALLRDFREIGKPYDQGYWVAGQLRQALGMTQEEPADPRSQLESWGVPIEAMECRGCPVDAVTAWGQHHGPVVILNHAPGSRSAHEYGERATLAHEIAHLLIDREGALSAGEVLGGRVPQYAEKRARAFQAEYLLPREVAAERVRNAASLEEAAPDLQRDYRFSTELLAWQIHNSTVLSALSADDKTLLEQWKKGAVELPLRE